MDPGSQIRPAGTLHVSPAAADIRLARACGAIALLCVATFASVCGSVQFLRSEYNPLGVPLSFYAFGPYGRAVMAAYFTLSPGLAALGIGWYRALGRNARSAAPLLLFVIAGVALSVTAIEFTDVPAHVPTLHGFLHIVAAGTTFICVTVAMLLQSWRLRRDPRWRAHFRSAFGLAAIAFAALWIYALVKPIPRGLGQKAVIALILLWLWRAGWWLARGRAN
jgi:Protein of unknown function (DUF998)